MVGVGTAVKVLAALFVVVAGCLSPQGPADDVVDDAPSAIGFALPDAMRIGTGADAESSIDVSKDGRTILVCSHGGFTQPSPLWVSTDSGATFRKVTPQPNQPFNGDCDVSIAEDGTWGITYDTIASATVALSTDEGRSWTVNAVTAAPIGGVDRPWLHVLDRDTAYMTYTSVGAGQPDVDTFAVSNDAGRSWVQRPMFLPEPPEKSTTTPGDMYVEEEGRTIRVPFIRGGDSGDYLQNAVSRDAGLTWALEQVAGPVQSANGIPTGDRADDGVLFFGYGASNRDTGDVMVVFSRDDGKTWSEPTIVARDQIFGGLLNGQVWLDARLGSSATLFWVNQTEVDGETRWQHKAARIHVGDDVAVDGITLVGPSSPPHPSDLYEFATVRHDGAGRAYFAFPLAIRPDCKETPQFPSQVGSQNIPRNTACQFVTIEAAS